MARAFNIVIDQGANFEEDFTLSDADGNSLNVSGYTANATIKEYYTYGNAVAFSTSLTTGKVTITMNANTTSNLAPGRYVFDVKITDGDGVVTRVVEGQATVSPKVT